MGEWREQVPARKVWDWGSFRLVIIREGRGRETEEDRLEYIGDKTRETGGERVRGGRNYYCVIMSAWFLVMTSFNDGER